jgi:hypothetical protein
VLVTALIAGEGCGGLVCLPPPFERYTINLAAFDPARDFAQSQKEAYVL